jgi:integrase
MTTGIRLKYVHRWVDNRSGGARARYYFRRPGFKRVPLPGLPGSSEFMEAYQAALAGQALPRPMIGASRTKAGSISALIVSYFASAAFLSLRPATQQTYRNILERFRTEHGDKPVALLTRQHINAILASKVLTPAAANHWLRLIKSLMAFAVEDEWRKDDPTVGVKRVKSRTDGFHTWTEGEIAQFEATHPVGSKARLALALLLYTAQRRSDVVGIGRQHIRDGVLHLRQKKTGAALAIPIHHELARIIAATPSANLTLLTTSFRKPFTAAGFGNWFREQCNEAQLPSHCAAHGLRKAACRRLAEAGCSANVIASISGHRTLAEVSRYTKAADQERMARDGMAAIARTKTGNGDRRVAKSAKNT